MHVGLLVVDWSGTVSDDFDVVLYATNGVLTQYGCAPVTRQELQENYQANPYSFYRNRGVEASREELAEIFHRCLRDPDAPAPRIIPGAADALRAVKNRTCIAVFSSHPQSALQREIDQYGLRGVFEHVVGDADKSKPAELEMLLRLAKVKKREDVLFAGDTTVDIAIGQAVGVRTVAIVSEHAYQTRQTVLAHRPPAQHYVEHISGVADLARNGQ